MPSSMTLPAVAVAAVVLLAASWTQAAPQNSNLAALGNSNIDTLLKNGDLVRMSLGCVKGTSNCNRLGIQLKKAIPEVLGNNCRACTPKQKENADKLVRFVQTNYPRDYQQISARYLRNGSG